MSTDNMIPTYERWRSEFELLEDGCPWPGPRPVERAKASMLVGRERDAELFRRLVQQHRLVLLDGESGIGKSSLLEASLVPELQSAGYVVAVCNEWTDDSNREVDAVTFVKERIIDALEQSESELERSVIRDAPSGSVEFFEYLQSGTNCEVVLLFDQFEELLRYSEQRAEEVIDLMLDLNQFYELRVVVSLRSEYLHRLRRLERDAKPWSYTKFALEEIDPADAEKLIRLGGDSSVITDEAVVEIISLWKGARSGGAERAGTLQSRVGLLHLQALLYTLYNWRRDPGAPIDVKQIKELRKHAQERLRVAAGELQPASVFGEAMSATVQTKLNHCTQAAVAVGIDPYLINGASNLVARAAPHLSSGGYKLHREAGELADQAIDDELDYLTGTSTHLRENSAELVSLVLHTLVNRPDSDGEELDLISSTWEDLLIIFDDLDTRFDLRKEIHFDRANAYRGDCDPNGVTCGPMMGMPPAAVLIEELRRFALAVRWMKEASLVRLTTPTTSRTVVALMHDRFGEGLTRWAKTQSSRPGPHIHAITAPRGATFNWKLGPGRYHSELDGTDGGWVLPNLRWAGASISADFRGIVFANCDLRGALFTNCRFDGVDFVNCLLDGAMFDRCKFVGSPPSPFESAGHKHSPDTRFEIAKPSRFIIGTEGDRDSYAGPALLRYRLLSSATTSLYSGSAGLPLLPGDAREALDDLEPPTAWTPASRARGVCIYGGRVSTLVVRACSFPDDGTLAFRHVLGTGLSLVEQSDATAVEIHASALRHLALSTRDVFVDGSMRPSAGSGVSLSMEVTSSALLQAWISIGFRGKVKVSDSAVIQLWNSSDVAVDISSAFVFDIVGCNARAVTDLATNVEESRSSVFSDDEKIDPSRMIFGMIDEVDYTEAPEQRFFREISRN